MVLSLMMIAVLSWLLTRERPFCCGMSINDKATKRMSERAESDHYFVKNIVSQIERRMEEEGQRASSCLECLLYILEIYYALYLNLI